MKQKRNSFTSFFLHFIRFWYLIEDLWLNNWLIGFYMAKMTLKHVKEAKN